MRALIIAAMVLLTATPALARPGFFIGLGGGYSTAGGKLVTNNRLLPQPGTTLGPGYAPTTDIDGGLSPLFHMGFNILGYGALELVASGHWHDLFNASTRDWAAGAHIGGRIYPMWHWQSKLPIILQPLEPSLFFGWGTTYQGYAPNTEEEVAWSTWKSLRTGFGLEYFILSYFKVSLDYYWVRAPHNKFLYDAGDSQIFVVEPVALVNFHQFYVTATFQFGPPQEAVRYEQPPAAPTTSPAIEPKGQEPTVEPEAPTEAEPAVIEHDI
jgi:hypothetical protein